MRRLLESIMVSRYSWLELMFFFLISQRLLDGHFILALLLFGMLIVLSVTLGELLDMDEVNAHYYMRVLLVRMKRRRERSELAVGEAPPYNRL